MNETIIFLERGILGWETFRGDWKQWPNQGVAWIHNRAKIDGKDWRGQTLEYFTGPLTAGMTRTHRAKQFGEMVRQYKDWERNIIIAHSEGTATVLKSLKLAFWPRVEELHLVCGACDADFMDNGLNYALSAGRVGHVHVYVAGQDQAMWAENTWLGKLAFELPRRCRPLGLHGPSRILPGQQSKVTVVDTKPWDQYRHSECWQPLRFEKTMEQLTQNL